MGGKIGRYGKMGRLGKMDCTGKMGGRGMGCWDYMVIGLIWVIISVKVSYSTLSVCCKDLQIQI